MEDPPTPGRQKRKTKPELDAQKGETLHYLGSLNLQPFFLPRISFLVIAEFVLTQSHSFPPLSSLPISQRKPTLPLRLYSVLNCSEEKQVRQLESDLTLRTFILQEDQVFQGSLIQVSQEEVSVAACQLQLLPPRIETF